MLEDQLGTRLFARSNEGLSLTAQGRKFREHVEAMAAAALRAEAAVSATGPQARGAVKLSIGATLAAHWLMPRMGASCASTTICSSRSSPIRFRPACAAARPTSCCVRSTAARKTWSAARSAGSAPASYASRDYAARRRLAGAARRMEGPQRHRLCRPGIECAAGALERSHHPAGHRGDALLVAGRHARRRAGRPRDIGAVLLRRRAPIPTWSASRRKSSVSVADLWLLAHPDLVDLPAVRAVIGFVTACAREDRVRLRG